MTLSQLRAFALVARLGSVRAAAAALGVSEPAVSNALSALRHDLGDPLLVRSGGGLALTPGGRRLAAHADEIVGLADRVRREVAAAGSSDDVLRVVVTAAFEEHAAHPLVDAYTHRSPGTSVDLLHEQPDRLADCLLDRSADLVLGLRPAAPAGVALDVVPVLRYRRVVVTAAGRAADPGADRWFAGPHGVEAGTPERRWLEQRVPLSRVERLPSESAALAAVLAGEGVMLALAHVVREDVAHGALVTVPAAGTPVHGLWCATALGHGRATPAARGLLRFVTTPDATAAMLACARVPRPRPAPSVHVTLWS